MLSGLLRTLLLRLHLRVHQGVFRDDTLALAQSVKRGLIVLPLLHISSCWTLTVVEGHVGLLPIRVRLLKLPSNTPSSASLVAAELRDTALVVVWAIHQTIHSAAPRIVDQHTFLGTNLDS